MSTSLLRVPMAAKALVTVVFAALFFVGLQAPAAHAAADVTVTLNVTTKAGAGLTGLNVYAYPIDNHAIVGDGVTASYVGSSKTYQIALDPTTQYTFYFDAPASATTAFDQFLGGTTWPEEAQSFRPTAGATLNVTLATNSTITGKVTGLSSKALAGVSVYPWRFDGNGWFRLANAVAVTGATGVYTMRNLEPGTYRLEFAPANTSGYLREYSGNTTVRDSAQPLNVGLGATVAYNAALTTGGGLSGSVKIFFDGGEFSPYGITAFAYRVIPSGPHAGEIDTEYAYTSRPTGRDGKWAIPGLPAGDYKIKLYDTDTYAFVDKWVGKVTTNPAGADTVAGAGVYSVIVGKTTVTTGVPRLDFYDDLADTSLELNVDDANGNPLGDDSVVYIESTTGEDFYFQSGDDFGLRGGTMNLLFMPAGDYKLWIDPDDDISQPYIGTQTIGSTGNTWNIELDPVSAFTYSLPATESHATETVGSLTTITRGHTSLDDGAGLERDVEYTYLWLRDGNPIFGAQSTTSNTYTSRGADLGHQISVIVRADAFGYAPIFTVLDVVTPTRATAPQIDAGDPPALAGPATPLPGSVLTAKVGTWDTTGLTYTYTWLRDGAEIPGATLRTYTTTAADAGHAIRFEVTASKLGYATAAPVASGNTIAVGYLVAPRPTKTSTFKVTTIADGVRVVATPGTWSPAATSYEYRWKVGDEPFTTSVPILECTATGVAPCTSGGLAITLTVVAHRGGYSDGLKSYVVRRGNITPDSVPGPIGFVYDATDGGHPSFDATSDPAQFGHTLRASDPVYTYASGDGGTLKRSYQWQRLIGTTWSNISKATRVTYIPTTSDVSRQLRLRIITTSTLYPTKTEYFTAGTGRYRLDLVNGSLPDVTITGTSLAGTTKRATVTGSWAVSGVTQSYQWYSCMADCADPLSTNWVAISKATSSSLVPSSAYKGRQLMVRVIGSKSGYQSLPIRSAALEIDPAANPDQVMAFTTPAYTSGLMGGQAVVGRTITVTPASLDRSAGVTRSYVWHLCDDVACSVPSSAGSTTTKLTPAGSLLADGQPHWVRITEYITVAGHSTALEGAAIPLVAGSWAPTRTPGLTTQANTPGAGQTTWNVSPGTWPGGILPQFDYAWYVGTELQATGPSFEQATGTDPIWVEVTVTRTGYVPLTYRLIARKGAFPAQSTALSGARYGDALQLSTPVTLALNAPAASVGYQWYLGTKAITGATRATFTPSTGYIGKSVRLRVSVVSPFYTTTAFYSDYVVLGAHVAATGTPTIVSAPGTFAPGAKLTVAAVGYPSGMSYGYTWQRSTNGGGTWSTISTKSSYVLIAADAGSKIRVQLRAARSGWSTSTLTSVEQTIGYSAPLALTAPFVLGGTGLVDTTMTAPTAWNTSGFALAYRWTRNGVVIPGATSSSVVPSASWYGDEVQAEVTATKAGYLPVTVLSNTVRVAEGAAPTSPPVAVTRSGGVLSVTSGVWSVAGVAIDYAWYASGDVGGTVLGTASTIDIAAHPGVTTFVAIVTAKRVGYADGSVSKGYTVST